MRAYAALQNLEGGDETELESQEMQSFQQPVRGGSGEEADGGEDRTGHFTAGRSKPVPESIASSPAFPSRRYTATA